MKLIVAILAILFCSCLSRAQNYECVELKVDEGTRQGYSATIVYIQKKTYKFLRGTAVLDAESKEPVAEVFVEVFAVDRKTKELKRVAGCRTGENGRFGFTDLAEGKYVLRFSKDGGFAITEIRVKVSPKSKRSEDIEGIVHLGS